MPDTLTNHSSHRSTALAVRRPSPGLVVLQPEGSWKVGHLPESVPQALDEIFSETTATHRLAFDCRLLDDWDSAFVAFVRKVTRRAEEQDCSLDRSGLPDGAVRLLDLASAVPEREGARRRPKKSSWIAEVGNRTLKGYTETRHALTFMGETLLATGRMLTGKARFRKVDVFTTMQQCGPEALPIITIISLLVGMILAFLGSIQLKLFGAQVFVADLVGIGMVREMGALMTGIIMAGRTGASFAAHLGTMQVNEEIDALETLGFSPIDFLVLPRSIALILMLPLLCLYANVLGILGGGIVGITMLDLTVSQYVTQTIQAVTMTGILSGLFKAGVFGVLIAFTGCLEGLRCSRSASGVGEATTNAVVSAIVHIIVADCAITVVYIILGI